ncbi:MAG: aminotransferase class IV [candidate division Zixibacteria bacterium]|nr:aminotransferase class IV [candidate division Zixibacteria bacterium]
MASVATLKSKRRTVVSIDGRLVAGGQARIGIDDWGFRYGWGAFETIRVSGGQPVFLERHLERFGRTARALLLTGEDEAKWWRRSTVTVLSHAGRGERVLNLYWTRGEAPLFHGRRILCLRPLSAPSHAEARIWIAPWRIGAGVPGIGAKTLAYLPYTFSSICAAEADCTDAILLNSRGKVADGSSASVFLIAEGRLLTPPLTDGALPGITRGVVMELASQSGIPVRQISLTQKRLESADGIFLTSSLRGLRAVTRVNEQKVSMSADARRIFLRIKRAYAAEVARDVALFRNQGATA